MKRRNFLKTIGLIPLMREVKKLLKNDSIEENRAELKDGILVFDKPPNKGEQIHVVYPGDGTHGGYEGITKKDIIEAMRSVENPYNVLADEKKKIDEMMFRLINGD
jgi:hypothetical protein